MRFGRVTHGLVVSEALLAVGIFGAVPASAGTCKHFSVLPVQPDDKAIYP